MMTCRFSDWTQKRGGAVALPLVLYGQGPRLALLRSGGPACHLIGSPIISHLRDGLQVSSQRRSPLGGDGRGGEGRLNL